MPGNEDTRKKALEQLKAEQRNVDILLNPSHRAILPYWMEEDLRAIKVAIPIMIANLKAIEDLSKFENDQDLLQQLWNDNEDLAVVDRENDYPKFKMGKLAARYAEISSFLSEVPSATVAYLNTLLPARYKDELDEQIVKINDYVGGDLSTIDPTKFNRASKKESAELDELAGSPDAASLLANAKFDAMSTLDLRRVIDNLEVSIRASAGTEPQYRDARQNKLDQQNLKLAKAVLSEKYEKSGEAPPVPLPAETVLGGWYSEKTPVSLTQRLTNFVAQLLPGRTAPAKVASPAPPAQDEQSIAATSASPVQPKSVFKRLQERVVGKAQAAESDVQKRAGLIAAQVDPMPELIAVEEVGTALPAQSGKEEPTQEISSSNIRGSALPTIPEEDEDQLESPVVAPEALDEEIPPAPVTQVAQTPIAQVPAIDRQEANKIAGQQQGFIDQQKQMQIQANELLSQKSSTMELSGLKGLYERMKENQEVIEGLQGQIDKLDPQREKRQDIAGYAETVMRLETLINLRQRIELATRALLDKAMEHTTQGKGPKLHNAARRLGITPDANLSSGEDIPLMKAMQETYARMLKAHNSGKIKLKQERVNEIHQALSDIGSCLFAFETAREFRGLAGNDSDGLKKVSVAANRLANLAKTEAEALTFGQNTGLRAASPPLPQPSQFKEQIGRIDSLLGHKDLNDNEKQRLGKLKDVLLRSNGQLDLQFNEKEYSLKLQKRLKDLEKALNENTSLSSKMKPGAPSVEEVNKIRQEMQAITDALGLIYQGKFADVSNEPNKDFPIMNKTRTEAEVELRIKKINDYLSVVEREAEVLDRAAAKAAVEALSKFADKDGAAAKPKESLQTQSSPKTAPVQTKAVPERQAPVDLEKLLAGHSLIYKLQMAIMDNSPEEFVKALNQLKRFGVNKLTMDTSSGRLEGTDAASSYVASVINAVSIGGKSRDKDTQKSIMDFLNSGTPLPEGTFANFRKYCVTNLKNEDILSKEQEFFTRERSPLFIARGRHNPNSVIEELEIDAATKHSLSGGMQGFEYDPNYQLSDSQTNYIAYGKIAEKLGISIEEAAQGYPIHSVSTSKEALGGMPRSEYYQQLLNGKDITSAILGVKETNKPYLFSISDGGHWVAAAIVPNPAKKGEVSVVYMNSISVGRHSLGFVEALSQHIDANKDTFGLSVDPKGVVNASVHQQDYQCCGIAVANNIADIVAYHNELQKQPNDLEKPQRPQKTWGDKFKEEGVSFKLGITGNYSKIMAEGQKAFKVICEKADGQYKNDNQNKKPNPSKPGEQPLAQMINGFNKATREEEREAQEEFFNRIVANFASIPTTRLGALDPAFIDLLKEERNVVQSQINAENAYKPGEDEQTRGVIRRAKKYLAKLDDIIVVASKAVPGNKEEPSTAAVVSPSQAPSPSTDAQPAADAAAKTRAEVAAKALAAFNARKAKAEERLQAQERENVPPLSQPLELIFQDEIDRIESVLALNPALKPEERERLDAMMNQLVRFNDQRNVSYTEEEYSQKLRERQKALEKELRGKTSLLSKMGFDASAGSEEIREIRENLKAITRALNLISQGRFNEVSAEASEVFAVMDKAMTPAEVSSRHDAIIDYILFAESVVDEAGLREQRNKVYAELQKQRSGTDTAKAPYDDAEITGRKAQPPKSYGRLDAEWEDANRKLNGDFTEKNVDKALYLNAKLKFWAKDALVQKLEIIYKKNERGEELTEDDKLTPKEKSTIATSGNYAINREFADQVKGELGGDHPAVRKLYAIVEKNEQGIELAKDDTLSSAERMQIIRPFMVAATKAKQQMDEAQAAFKKAEALHEPEREKAKDKTEQSKLEEELLTRVGVEPVQAVAVDKTKARGVDPEFEIIRGSINQKRAVLLAQPNPDDVALDFIERETDRLVKGEGLASVGDLGAKIDMRIDALKIEKERIDALAGIQLGGVTLYNKNAKDAAAGLVGLQYKYQEHDYENSFFYVDRAKKASQFYKDSGNAWIKQRQDEIAKQVKQLEADKREIESIVRAGKSPDDTIKDIRERIKQTYSEIDSIVNGRDTDKLSKKEQEKVDALSNKAKMLNGLLEEFSSPSKQTVSRGLMEIDALLNARIDQRKAELVKAISALGVDDLARERLGKELRKLEKAKTDDNLEQVPTSLDKQLQKDEDETVEHGYEFSGNDAPLLQRLTEAFKAGLGNLKASFAKKNTVAPQKKLDALPQNTETPSNTTNGAAVPTVEGPEKPAAPARSFVEAVRAAKMPPSEALIKAAEKYSVNGDSKAFESALDQYKSSKATPPAEQIICYNKVINMLEKVPNKAQNHGDLMDQLGSARADAYTRKNNLEREAEQNKQLTPGQKKDFVAPGEEDLEVRGFRKQLGLQREKSNGSLQH